MLTLRRRINLLYTHKHNDINNNSTYTYPKTQADSFVQIRTVYSLLSSLLRHEERDTILKSLSSLYNTPNVRHITWFFRSQFIFAGRDPKNLTVCLNGRNPNYSTPWSELNSKAENSILCPNGRNSNVRMHGPISNPQLRLSASMAENTTDCLHGPKSTPNWLFFKIFIFSGPSLPGITSFTGVYYDYCDCYILCARAYNCTQWAE